MFNWDDEELEQIVENLTDIMLSLCQDCRFIAAAKVIESVDIKVVKDLQISIDYRLNDLSGTPSIEPVPEPKHRKGGCCVHCRG